MTKANILNQNKIASLMIDKNATVLEAMKVIDQGAVQIAFVVGPSKKLMGVVTDGDLRRAILSGATLTDPIAKFVNTKFRSVTTKTGRTEALDLMKCFSIEQLPILDDAGSITGLHLLNELIQSQKLPNAAMILAGGKGTRLGKLTQSTPKPMIKVAGRPILERIVLHLVGSGIQNIFLSVSYLADVIEDHFKDGAKFGCNIAYLREDEPLGTGGPLSLLPAHGVEDSVLVMNGDLIVDFDVSGFLTTHHGDNNAVTVGVRTYAHEVPFGCLSIENGRVEHLVEKPILQQTINTGIYAIAPEIVKSVKPQFMPITSLIENAIAQKQRVGAFPIEDWIDVGQPAQLAEARGAI